MKIGSLFAGIGGFDLAFRNVGATTVWASEIDPFAQRVLRARFPEAELVGDIAAWEPDPVRHAVDVITFGFPCQDLSVAGKREGLDGKRSGLFYEAARVVGILRPRWILAENVPGLLSSKRGDDFEAVLRTLDELGYGLSWRVCDAQGFGVPQRRRRVFIVGRLGAHCPPEVLFEPESVRGDPPTGRKARKGATAAASGRAPAGGGAAGATEGAESPEAKARAIGQIELLPVVGDAPIRGYRADSPIADVDCRPDNSVLGGAAGAADQAHRGGQPISASGVWWDGGDTAASLTTRCHQQFMPDKGNFAAVITPTDPAKPLAGHHIRRDLDHETYVLDEEAA